MQAKSQLARTNLASFKHEVVQFLSTEYNGNVIFKLPSLPLVKEGGVARLNGMDRRFNGHAWTKTATTNIVDPNRLLSFKYVKCMGHLRCSNSNYRHIKEIGDYNEMYWVGLSHDVLTPGPLSKPSPKCKLVCKHYRRTPSCLVLCPCRMFYIVSKDPLMSRACVHIGTHGHPVAKGHCRDALIQIREKVKDEVARTPNATPSAISLVVGKELLMQGLIDEDGGGNNLLESEHSLVFEKWSKLSTSSMNNMISDAKLNLGLDSYVNNILKLKRGSRYDFIHDSCFPGQGSNLAYFFKMSTVRPGSGVDLVRGMQKGGNLQSKFIMFDHVKRVPFWTTLGAPVYDPMHCKVMIVYVCDMKSEIADHQKQMWMSLIAVMEKHGVKDVNFARFMADSAQANFNAFREVFGSRDKSEPMLGRERTCQFHWSQTLERHTKQLIKPKLQEVHKRLCHEYRLCKTKADADATMEAIRA